MKTLLARSAVASAIASMTLVTPAFAFGVGADLGVNSHVGARGSMHSHSATVENSASVQGSARAEANRPSFVNLRQGLRAAYNKGDEAKEKTEAKVQTRIEAMFGHLADLSARVAKRFCGEQYADSVGSCMNRIKTNLKASVSAMIEASFTAQL